MDFINYLADVFQALSIQASKQQMNQLDQFKRHLLLINQSMNLTAITDEKEIAVKHFVDSLKAAKAIPEGGKIIDVGTGAGFPGIPLKIMNPSLEITLLDSLAKRVRFLEESTALLQLKQVTCIHGRAEEIGRQPDYREQFDICISRAVANLAVLAELCLPFVRVDGYFIGMKGPKPEEEIISAKPAMDLLGGVVESVKIYELPDGYGEHSLVMIKKFRQTPPKYARKMSNILKKPLL